MEKVYLQFHRALTVAIEVRRRRRHGHADGVFSRENRALAGSDLQVPLREVDRPMGQLLAYGAVRIRARIAYLAAYPSFSS